MTRRSEAPPPLFDDLGDCPDGGRCHHQCAADTEPCFRVLYCAPLSGYGSETWSEQDYRDALALAPPGEPTVGGMVGRMVGER